MAGGESLSNPYTQRSPRSSYTWISHLPKCVVAVALLLF